MGSDGVGAKTFRKGPVSRGKGRGQAVGCNLRLRLLGKEVREWAAPEGLFIAHGWEARYTVAVLLGSE